ncbi:sensor histidine kinase [Paenibacillus sp. GCM10027626]|uniref:sensor histidine kinase n=1 Tax=Paenibacillus sp. GCM10027626 TaxID=3273411 RepID=UPI0036290970
MRRNKTIVHSIRFKLIVGLLLIVLPILIYLTYNNKYSIQVVRNQVASASVSTVTLYMNIVDNILQAADSYILRLINEQDGFLPLEISSAELTDTYALQKLWVFQKLREDSQYFTSHEFMFIYSTVNDELLFAPNVRITGNDNLRELQNAVEAYVRTDLVKMGKELKWIDANIGERSFVMRVIKSGRLYIGLAIDVNQLLGPLNLLNLGQGGKAVFTNALHKPLQETAFFEGRKIDLAFNEDEYKLTGEQEQYLLVGKSSTLSTLRLIALIPDDVILEQLPYLLRITYVLVGIYALIVAAAFYALRRVVLLPIQRILFAMRIAREGILEHRIPRYPTSSEFESMNESFNGMVSQIQQLKIDVYEEQLAKQQVEFRQLQLQINPHFFLNSLNIVYYLAADKKFTLIQELSLALIHYFRFVFQNGADTVALQDEIGHVGNYVRIQCFRFPGNLTYEAVIPETLQTAGVPPLMIQTFVENAIKYAIDTDRRTHIRIEASTLTRGDISIVIQDTGPGFPEDILESLQAGVLMAPDQGERIGIWNVQRRLELLYKGKAQVKFENDNGARVEVILPRKDTP